MSASNTWLRFICLPFAFFPWLCHETEQQAEIVRQTDKLGSMACHSLSCVTLTELLTSLNFPFLIINWLWGPNGIIPFKSIPCVDIQKALMPVSSSTLNSEEQLNSSGHCLPNT
jgi:hypothetical protein